MSAEAATRGIDVVTGGRDVATGGRDAATGGRNTTTGGRDAVQIGVAGGSSVCPGSGALSGFKNLVAQA